MTDRPPHNPQAGDDCRCFRCHIASIQLSPAATPTRRTNR